MKSYLYRILSLSLVIALFENSAFAKRHDSDSYATTASYENYGKNDYSNNYGSSDSNQNDDQESDYYPFTKSQNRIEDEDVVGIRIDGKKVILLGESKTYSEEYGLDSNKPDFFSKYSRLISVDLSNISLTKEVLDDLKKHLPKTIKGLIVNLCSIAKENFEEFTDIITKHSQLESLTVLNPNMAEAETAKLLAAIEDLSVIRYLNLTLGEIGANGCDILNGILTKSKGTLEGLNLGFMKVDDSKSYDELLTSLGQLKKLKRLEYSVLESTESQVGEFFSSLANLKEITDLKICFDDFNSHDGVESYQNSEAFSAALKNLTKLENLDVSNMNLPDSSLQMITGALGDLGKVKTLNISGNPITAKTAGVLAESLKKMDNLVSLIANNCEMKDDAFSALCSGLQDSSLQYLYLRDNSIGGSVKSLQVSQMKNLVAINFANNNITLLDVIDFMKGIPEDSKLAVVNWEGNDFKGLSGSRRTEEMNKLKIWKKEHGVTTLDLGI